MRLLGIESTAHTFGVAIVEHQGENGPNSWKVLSSVRRQFTTESGGLIPAKVSDHHVQVCGEALGQALLEAGVALGEIDGVAFSQGPGIGNMLRVGAAMARSICLQHKLPLIPVNHCIAHLEIGRAMSGFSDPLLLYASGANTQIITYEGGKYRVLGETLDVGVGNFLDTVGRELNLGFPAGAHIEQLALQGSYYPLPYRVKGMDLSLAGLHTRIRQDISKGVPAQDICCSVQETVFAMLCEITERALAHTGKQELVLGGGVACNKRLQAMVTALCEARGVKWYAPPKEFLVDNAAMIAISGILQFQAGQTIAIADSVILPQQRTDEVKVFWRD